MNKLLVQDSFRLFGLQIHFYGIFVALAFIAAIIVCLWFCKAKKYNSDIVLNLVLLIMPMALVGARLYYVIFSNRNWSFAEIVSFWDGGFAVFGGIIGGVLAIIIYCLIKKESIVKVFDMAAPALLLGQSIGRIGCFFAGCCYGQLVVNPAMQWFPFAVEMFDGWHYATFFYESLWCLIGFIPSVIVFLKTNIKGLCSGVYLVWYGIGRCVIESFRGDSLFIGQTGIRVSQLLSVLIIIGGIVWLTLFITKDIKSKKVNKE